MSVKNHSESVDTLSSGQKQMLKEIKRDLIRFVPPMIKRSRKPTRELDTPEMLTASSDYGRSYDTRNPTFSVTKKSTELEMSPIISAISKRSTARKTA